MSDAKKASAVPKGCSSSRSTLCGSGKNAMSHESKYFLCTQRLGFRLWSPDDFDLAFGLWGDLKVTKLIDARGQLSKNQVKKRLVKEIATAESYSVQYWPIFLLSNDEHIGCCGLRPYDVSQAVYEIGLQICSKHWKRGFASEGARAVMEYAFDKLGVSGLFAGHNPKNEASRHLLEKLGFRYSHDEYYAPTRLNHPSYMMTADEYVQLKNSD